MKKIKKAFLATVILSVNTLLAHSLWVNSFESFSHKPGHAIVSLGWGHSIPIDDILNSPNGRVVIEDFSLINPKGEKTQLKIPSSETAKANKTTKDFDLYDADIALQKIALKKESIKGVYTIQANSKPTFYTSYLDSKNRQRLKLKPKNEVKDIKKILMSVRYQANAKSYLTLDKWTEQKATNKGLEIIPKTDLSNVRVGDLVEFEILFMGTPLNASPSSMDYIKAASNTFGQKEGFALMSSIVDGKAQIRVQSAGQWIVSCNHKTTITKDGPLKELYNKVNYSFIASSLTFNVKE